MEFPLPTQAFFPGLSFYLIMDRTYIYWTIASTLVSFHFPENSTLLKITQDLFFTSLYNKLFVHSVNAPCNCLYTIAFTPTHLNGLYFKYSMCSLQAIVGLQNFRHFLVAYTGFVKIAFKTV